MSIPYNLTRSKRKTIGIYIRQGGVEVRAPLRCPKAEIDKFVASKEVWIKEKLAQSTEQQAEKDEFILKHGDSISRMKLGYIEKAKAYIPARVAHFAKQMNVMPAAVKINSAKSRWGSCSNRKNLNFSWRLIMANDAVIDYVVVHELAHLTEMNHSPKFWTIVEGILPDFKERRTKLKELQKRLAVEDWEYDLKNSV